MTNLWPYMCIYCVCRCKFSPNFNDGNNIVIFKRNFYLSGSLTRLFFIDQDVLKQVGTHFKLNCSL